MGPEPLSAAFDGRYLAKMFKDKIAPVKAALLDQRIVAGLGNIYVCEALHLAGIEPGRASGRIRKQRLARLAVAVPAVLSADIFAGGSTLRDLASPDGALGVFWGRVKGRGREK